MRLSDKTYSLIFLIGAIWNWSASIPGAVMPKMMIPMIFGSAAVDMILNNTYAYIGYNFTMFSICQLGLGYFIVSRDLKKNYGIVVLGTIGKFFFFGYLAYHFLLGNVTPFMLSMVIVDLIFGILFLFFLIQYRIQKE